MNHRATESTEGEKDELSREVIGAATEVDRALGPGLVESACEECLCHELTLREVAFERQVPQPPTFKGIKLECGYRLALVVRRRLIVEVKAVEALHPIHTARLLTYLKLSGIRVGLLMTFHSVVLKDGLRRLVV